MSIEQNSKSSYSNKEPMDEAFYIPYKDDKEIQVRVNPFTYGMIVVGYCLTTGRLFDIDQRTALTACLLQECGIPVFKCGYVEDFAKDRYDLGVWSVNEPKELTRYN
jgi:hypothetical protein